MRPIPTHVTLFISPWTIEKECTTVDTFSRTTVAVQKQSLLSPRQSPCSPAVLHVCRRRNVVPRRTPGHTVYYTLRIMEATTQGTTDRSQPGHVSGHSAASITHHHQRSEFPVLPSVSLHFALTPLAQNPQR